MSRNMVSEYFVQVWFSLYFDDETYPPGLDWYLVPVTDYATQRPEWQAWYQADVDGRPWALAGRYPARLSLERLQEDGYYRVKRDNLYMDVPSCMVDDAVFVLMFDEIAGEGAVQ